MEDDKQWSALAEVEPQEPERVRKAAWPSPSIILVAMGVGGHGVAMVYHGGGVERWIDDVTERCDDLALDTAPVGLSIWEGRLASTYLGEGEYDCALEGKFRPLTTEEWKLLSETGEPWGYEP